MKNCIKNILYVAVFCIGVISAAEASFIHNVGGTDYEWMEFSATVNQSRRDVEAQFVDANSALYGYRYASQAETMALLESYTGTHNLEEKYTRYADGMNALFTDFGTLSSTYIGTVAINQGAYGDNTIFDFSHMVNSYFYYGNANECDNEYWTCWGRVEGYALNGSITAYEVDNNWGWDVSATSWQNTSALSPAYQTSASLIVKDVSAVPVPAAVWLFGSGLVGLAGLARRKARS